VLPVKRPIACAPLIHSILPGATPGIQAAAGARTAAAGAPRPHPRAAAPRAGSVRTAAGRRGDVLLVAEGLSKTHDGDRMLFSSLSFTISAGDKLAIVGPNGAGAGSRWRGGSRADGDPSRAGSPAAADSRRRGASTPQNERAATRPDSPACTPLPGKSTLLQIIAGQMSHNGGVVNRNKGARIGYLPQVRPCPEAPASENSRSAVLHHAPIPGLWQPCRRAPRKGRQPGPAVVSAARADGRGAGTRAAARHADVLAPRLLLSQMPTGRRAHVAG
jgi:hypothetical protein